MRGGANSTSGLTPRASILKAFHHERGVSFRRDAACAALSRTETFRGERMVDLLWPRADDGRGHRAAGRQEPGVGPRRLGFRQIVARARGRDAQAGPPVPASRLAV